MGIQAIANSMREGFGVAAEELYRHVEATHDLADRHEISPEAAFENLTSGSPDIVASMRGTLADLFMGGLCNLSRHTSLSATLLEDLSFKRGENTEFFGPGPFCGTPMRTLPGRIKPLVMLQGEFYATDPCFVRDAAYRAIQRGVAARLPDYREEWNQRQKALTEAAFARILSHQLNGARILTEVYYPDPSTGQWVENDTLILIEDVLVQVEAKVVS
jgi:hypothetical protein